MDTFFEIAAGVFSVLALLNAGKWIGREFGTFEAFLIALLKKYQ